MAQVVHRDIPFSNGADMLYALYLYAKASGWTDVAHGTGTGGERSVGALAGVADISANPNAWFMIQHVTTGVRLSVSLGADTNTWGGYFTPQELALTPGNATTPDSHEKTRPWLASTQRYPTAGATTTLAQFVFDDTLPSFLVILRRTPFPGGSACSMMYFEQITPLTWSGNPVPFMCGGVYDDSNVAMNYFLISYGGFHRGWYAYGLAGETWYQDWFPENPGGVAGNGTRDPSGQDIEWDFRWARSTFILGVSELFRLLQPGIEPIVGLDEGTNWARAAFVTITVANDGSPLEP